MEKRLFILVTAHNITQADMDVLRVWFEAKDLKYDIHKVVSFKAKYIHPDGTSEEGQEKEAEKYRKLLDLLKVQHTTKIVQR